MARGIRSAGNKRMRALIVMLCLCGGGLAQGPTFRATVPTVLVPTTVTDKKNHYLNGLSAEDFVVLDNGVAQPIQLDTSDTTTIPLAVVFLVQSNDTSATAILKIRKVGAEIQPLITGDRGHAAVLLYGSQTAMVQDFTSDPEEITRAFATLDEDHDRKAVMLDAVAQAVTMLAMRPQNERRIIILIGETKDRGSKTKLDDVVKMVQRQSVTIFPVTYSAYMTPWTTKGSDMPPPDGGGGLLDIPIEMSRLGKVNAANVLATDSGGRRLSFATLHTLERMIGQVGEELHSQYLISYTAPHGQAGFHTIEVKVRDRSDAVVRARPGYWSDE